MMPLPARRRAAEIVGLAALCVGVALAGALLFASVDLARAQDGGAVGGQAEESAVGGQAEESAVGGQVEEETASETPPTPTPNPEGEEQPVHPDDLPAEPTITPTPEGGALPPDAPGAEGQGGATGSADSPSLKIQRYRFSVTEGANATFKLTASRAPTSQLRINVSVTQRGSYLTGTIPTVSCMPLLRLVIPVRLSVKITSMGAD